MKPPGPPLPILAAPLRSLLAPREGPAASLRGGLEAPAGPSDAAPGAGHAHAALILPMYGDRLGGVLLRRRGVG